MKTKYYYIRDKDRHPRITVCLIENKGLYARGVALCSFSENPIKAFGRTLALERAVTAMLTEESTERVDRDEAWDVFPGDWAFRFKSAYDVALEVADNPWSLDERKLMGVFPYGIIGLAELKHTTRYS